MDNCIAIAGIHTGIGKTIVSAVIAEALKADYWKPVQAGTEERDVTTIRQLVSHDIVLYDEAYLLTQPLSPHAAARIDGITIDHTKFIFPITDNLLLIETAGGIMSPVSDSATMADLMVHYHLPAILVVKHYLGSINHTLLSIELLRSRGIPLLGIIINGNDDKGSETFIAEYTKVPVIARVPEFITLNTSSIKECAANLRVSLLQNITHVIHKRT